MSREEEDSGSNNNNRTNTLLDALQSRRLKRKFSTAEGVENLIEQTSKKLIVKVKQKSIPSSSISPIPSVENSQNINKILYTLKQIEKKREEDIENKKNEDLEEEIERQRNVLLENMKGGLKQRGGSGGGDNRGGVFFTTKVITDLLEEDDDAQFNVIDAENNESIKKLQNDIEKQQIELIQSCDVFSEKFHDKIMSSKEKLEKELLDTFQFISRQKMPNVFLLSIKKYLPKLTKKTERQLNLLEKYPKKRQNTIKPIFDDDSKQDISGYFKDLINKSYFLAVEIINQVISDLKIYMSDIHSHNNNITQIVKAMKNQSIKLNEEVHSCYDILKKKVDILETMYEEMKMKQIQHDILLDQFKRREKTLKEQRAEFAQELEEVKQEFSSSGWSRRILAESNEKFLKNAGEVEVNKNDSEEVIKDKMKKKLLVVQKRIESETKKIQAECDKKVEERDALLKKKLLKVMELRAEMVRLKSQKN